MFDYFKHFKVQAVSRIGYDTVTCHTESLARESPDDKMDMLIGNRIVQFLLDSCFSDISRLNVSVKSFLLGKIVTIGFNCFRHNLNGCNGCKPCHSQAATKTACARKQINKIVTVTIIQICPTIVCPFIGDIYPVHLIADLILNDCFTKNIICFRIGIRNQPFVIVLFTDPISIGNFLGFQFAGGNMSSDSLLTLTRQFGYFCNRIEIHFSLQVQCEL